MPTIKFLVKHVVRSLPASLACLPHLEDTSLLYQTVLAVHILFTVLPQAHDIPASAFTAKLRTA